jgi:Spy/CpxP family protein refolding chaperone
MRDLAKAEPQDRWKKWVEWQQTMQAVLTPEQSARLRGIMMQFLGGQALNNPDVANELGLSDDQKAKLRDIFTKEGAERRTLFADTDTPREQRLEKVEKLTKQFRAEAMTVLTEEQHDKFEKMEGAKIDISTLYGGAGSPGK